MKVASFVNLLSTRREIPRFQIQGSWSVETARFIKVMFDVREHSLVSFVLLIVGNLQISFSQRLFMMCFVGNGNLPARHFRILSTFLILFLSLLVII